MAEVEAAKKKRAIRRQPSQDERRKIEQPKLTFFLSTA